MASTNMDYARRGLDEKQVEQSRLQHGRNLLAPPQRQSAWRLYFDKFKDPIIRILLIAAALSLIIGFYEQTYMETVGILIAIFLATGIGFYFEYDAQRKFDVLNALEQEELVTVIRGGDVTQVPRSELVVGDIVMLSQGDEVPADGTLLEAVNMEVNESSLTGEPLCSKTADIRHLDKDATYPSNKVLRSSMVANGHGIMKIDAVGMSTEIGHISRCATSMTATKTPLSLQLARLSKLINKCVIIISSSVFVIGAGHGIYSCISETGMAGNIDWTLLISIILKWFMVGVTLIVMAVPEGLPMAITLSLALNMRRMLKTNNLVRKLHACETMGAVNVICTDKTGTLTQNRMEVAEMHYDHSKEDLLTEGIALNSTAMLKTDGEGVGSPTECALLRHIKADYTALRDSTKILDQFPFSAERKYMATIAFSPTTGKRTFYLKGAPETVMSLCSIKPAETRDATNKLERYQSAAMRTLAFAFRELSEDEPDDCIRIIAHDDLRFIGICAIADPIRPEVPAAIESCRNAGILVKIVTGDNAGTAIEIARRIGLWGEEDKPEATINGKDFSALTDEEALKRIEGIKILSRARPTDKQRFVELLQKRGLVVAVTGDGTNDVPALSKAQVGLSMGSGTAMAKEASEITLIDDSFRSIVSAVMWGRSLYKNIQSFLAFQLTISLTALVITMAGAIMETDIPLTVTQILWINLIVDTFASLALSTIPPSPAVMNDRPRKSTDFIITPWLKRNVFATAFAFLAVLFGMLLYFCRWGNNSIPTEDLTIFFTFFVLLQFWNLVNARVLGSCQSALKGLAQCKGLPLVLAIILAGQILIVEFGGSVFRTVPINFQTWATLIVASSSVLWIGELIRFVQRKIAKR